MTRSKRCSEEAEDGEAGDEMSEEEQGQDEEDEDENDEEHEDGQDDDEIEEMLMDKLTDKLYDLGLNDYDQEEDADYSPDEVQDDELDEDELASVLGLRGNAMKAMKAMKKKAMKAMKKKKKAMKKYKKPVRTLKRLAFAGKIKKTKTGLTKDDLVKNKHGKIVSKKNSARGKKSPWIAAVNAARKALGTKGFKAVKKGSPLYLRAKSLYKPPMKSMKLMEQLSDSSFPLMALCALFVGAGLAFVMLRFRRSPSKPRQEPLFG